MHPAWDLAACRAHHDHVLGALLDGLAVLLQYIWQQLRVVSVVPEHDLGPATQPATTEPTCQRLVTADEANVDMAAWCSDCAHHSVDQSQATAPVHVAARLAWGLRSRRCCLALAGILVQAVQVSGGAAAAGQAWIELATQSSHEGGGAVMLVVVVVVGGGAICR